LEAIHDRHVPIDEDDADVGVLGDEVEGFLAVGGIERLEAEVVEDRADEGPNGTGIVNDQGQHPATVFGLWG
jgi:hypothetical protein